MPAPPPKEVTAENERRAWELRTKKFYTEQQIANELGLTQGAVSKMLARVEKKLHGEFSKQAERVKARQTVQLDTVINEAFCEWERSKLPAENERVVTKVKVTTDGRMDEEHDEPAEEEFQEITRETRGRIGDAQLLNQVRGAMADQRKIWGLEAPVERKLSGTGKDGAIKTEGGISFEDAVKLLQGGKSLRPTADPDENPNADDSGGD